MNPAITEDQGSQNTVVAHGIGLWCRGLWQSAIHVSIGSYKESTWCDRESEQLKLGRGWPRKNNSGDGGSQSINGCAGWFPGAIERGAGIELVEAIWLRERLKLPSAIGRRLELERIAEPLD